MKGQYPCQYPTPCTNQRTSQRTIFFRPADLERHYKSVHMNMDKKDCFPCDYTKCGRSASPFTRKQYYRDHLREYHKEDFGNPRGYNKMSKEKLDEARRQWLMGQHQSRKWWRCEKCLRRIHVAENGWRCQPCGIQCENDRRKLREERLEPQSLKPDLEQSCRCERESGYLGWVDGGQGEWVECPNCIDLAQLNNPLKDLDENQ